MRPHLLFWSILLVVAAVPARAEPLEPAGPGTMSPCVRREVIAGGRMQQRLHAYRNCTGYDPIVDTEGRVLPRAERDRCERVAERIRRDIRTEALRRCGEDPEGALGDLDSLVANPAEASLGVSPATRNEINRKLAEDDKELLEGYEDLEAYARGVDAAYAKLGLSPCLEHKVLADEALRQQIQEAAVCETAETDFRYSREPRDAARCDQDRKRVRAELQRQAELRCKERFGDGALERLDVLLVGQGERIDDDPAYRRARPPDNAPDDASAGEPEN